MELGAGQQSADFVGRWQRGPSTAIDQGCSCGSTCGDGFDSVGHGDECVPGGLAGVKYGFIVIEDAVGEIVVAHVLPDFFLSIEFGAIGRKQNDGDIVRHDKLVARPVPASPISDY